MDIKKLTDNLSVSPQISSSDLAAIKDQGFGSIICNRPDGEEMGQPTFAEIEVAAKEHGLEATYIPIVPGQPVTTEVAAFAAALADKPGPVLAYCRSGGRSTSMWSMVQANS